MMILRTAFLIGCTALAYALLNGWPDALPGVMRACFAVLAWVAGLGVWAKRATRKSEPAARARRAPGWTDYLAIGMAILAVESGFLWLLGAAPRPLESAGLLLEQQFRPRQAALRAVHSADGATRSGNWLWTEETRRPLPRRTDFKPGMKPEVFVRIQDPADAEMLLKGRVYVRAFALGRYENAGWSPLPGKSLTITADDSGFVKLAPPGSGRAIPHEVFHSATAAGQNALTALQGASEARISPLERIDDGLFLLPPPPQTGGYHYEAVSSPVRIEDLPDGGLVSAWPGAADELLAIPEEGEFGSRLRLLARRAAGVGSVKQQLLQLQDYLRTSLGYSLVTSNPRNLDPMENFLFEEKRGHCEYFATAGALMARALGLPSRAAYGWAGGTWYADPSLFIFRANEAHAWTEIWLENFGWVIMDPTPQTGIGAERAKVAAPGETLSDAVAADESDDDAAETDAAAVLTRLGLWLALGFGLPAGWMLVMRGKHRTDPDAVAEIPGAPAPGYLKLWRRACAVRGAPMPPGFTLRRQLSRLKDVPDFAAELLAYHYGTRYEGLPSDERLEKQLARRIRRWEVEFSGINQAREPQTRVP